MTPTLVGSTSVGCAFVAWALIALLMRTGVAKRIALDRPNERSLHQGVVPRIGGLVIVAIAAAVGLVGPTGLGIVAGIAAALMLLGAVDDRHGVPIGARLLAHLATAFAAAALLLPAAPVWQWLVLALALTWSMNLYNFMDGADGLAGSMAVCGFGAYAIAAWSANATGLALFAGSTSGAALGFLIHNWAPARVFMGDAGSVPLGFLAGALGIAGWSVGAWPAWFPVLVFSPFIFDATITLARRALRGERIWQAHREHLYQRMVRSGLGHGGTAVVWTAVMTGAAVSGLVSLSMPKSGQFGVLLTWFALYATVFAVTWRLGTRLDR